MTPDLSVIITARNEMFLVDKGFDVKLLADIEPDLLKARERKAA